jgi:hypothetical protein
VPIPAFFRIKKKEGDCAKNRLTFIIDAGARQEGCSYAGKGMEIVPLLIKNLEDLAKFTDNN